MGCSSSRQCTPAEQGEIFDAAAKEMLRRCITCSVASTDSLDKMRIPLPPEIEQVRQLSKNLRTVSAMAKSHMTAGQGGIGAEDRARATTGEGGMLEGLGGVEKDLFSKAAGFIDKAAEVLGAGVGAAAEKGFIVAADGLDHCIQSFEDPLNFAARGFVLNSRDGVIKVYTRAIENLKLQKPVFLIRGEQPHGPAQYKACPSNALSAEFAKRASGELMQAIAPLCIDIIARNEVQKDWDALMWKYDQANTKLKDYTMSEGFLKANGKTEVASSFPEGPINFDLNQYVAEQTVQQLASLMGEEEARLRCAPPQPSATTTEARMPVTFHLCFSKDLDGHLTLGKPLPFEYYRTRNS